MMQNPFTRLALLLVQLTFISLASARDSFGIWRSTDHGRSWVRVEGEVARDRRINALAIDGTTAYAGTDMGILVSTNSGQVWSRRSLSPAARVQSLAASESRIYAGTKTSGVFYTEDQGRTWLSWTNGLADPNVRSLVNQQGTLYAGTDSQGVFRRSMRDERWLPATAGLPADAQVFDLAVQDGTIFAALYSKGLFQLETSGARWKQVGVVRPLRFAAGEDLLVAGHNPGGIYRSVDQGTTWRMAKGLSDASPIWALGQSGTNFLAGTSPEGLLLSHDQGASWRPSVEGLPLGAAVIAIGSNRDYTLVGVLFPDNFEASRFINY